MQQVITAKQARQITGGRQPLIPVEYGEACKALAACVTLEGAKYWSDAADALAAWAKMYHDTTIEDDARRLKSRAAREMGRLARELRPKKEFVGTVPDARTINGVRPIFRTTTDELRNIGLTTSEAQDALALSKATVSRKRFETIINQTPAPRSPNRVARLLDQNAGTEEARIASFIKQLACCCRKVSSRRYRDYLGSRYNKSDQNVDLIERWLRELFLDGSEVVDWLQELQHGTATERQR